MTSWRADSSISAYGDGARRRNDPELRRRYFRDDIGGLSWPAALLSGRYGLQPRLLSSPILCPCGSHRAIISALIRFVSRSRTLATERIAILRYRRRPAIRNAESVVPS